MDSENSKKPSPSLQSQPSPRPKTAFQQPATANKISTQRQRRAATSAFDPHRHHFYHGRAASNITSHLKQKIPSHSFDPHTKQERQQNPAAYRKKASSITGWMEPHPKLQRPVTAPLQYFGRRPTSVTGFMRQMPPQPLLKALPYFGKHRTSVTDPSKCRDSDDPGASILTHCLTDRPSTRATPDRGSSPARRHRTAVPSLCSDESRDVPTTGRYSSPPRQQPREEEEEEEKGMQSTASADQNPTGAFCLPATPRSARASNAPSSSSSKISCSVNATRGSVSCPSTPRQKSRHGANSHTSLLGRAAELLAQGSAVRADRAQASKRNDDEDGLLSSRASVAESNLSSVCDSLGAERAEYVSHWAGQLQTWGVSADRQAEQSGAKPVDQITPVVPDYSRRATSITRHCIF